MRQYRRMLASIRDLVERAEAAPALCGLLDSGDWYLVGSRATGLGDELSDWDTVLLVADDPLGPDPDRALTDEVFGVVRPTWTGVVDLGFDREWRRSSGVDIEVIGPASRGDWETQSLSEWAFTMAQAVPLRVRTTFGDEYRRALGRRFDDERNEMQVRTYLHFRRSRNEAAAALARDDKQTRAIATAECVAAGARFLMVSSGRPYPPTKWLMTAVDRAVPSRAIGTVAGTILCSTDSAERRFTSLWELWRIIDQVAISIRLDPVHLDGSPFLET